MSFPSFSTTEYFHSMAENIFEVLQSDKLGIFSCFKGCFYILLQQSLDELKNIQYLAKQQQEKTSFGKKTYCKKDTQQEY